jgi:copper(I)-binding protein
VTELAIPAQRTTRLAPRGNFLELRGLSGTVANGQRVPLVLEFADAQGRRQRVETVVEIRGMAFGRAAVRTPAEGAGPPAAVIEPPGR